MMLFSFVVLYRLLISGKSSSLINALNFSEPPTTAAISLSFSISVKPVKSFFFQYFQFLLELKVLFSFLL